jgi:ribonuclease HI
MRFKGERVWVLADESGKLTLDESGRAEMKYRETDSKSYRPFAGNLGPDDGSPPSASALASASTAAAASTSTAAPASAKRKNKDVGGAAMELWTDGACSGNPGPMGIGVVAIDGGKRKEVGEYLGVGTNNIAELTAIERGLDLVADLPPAGAGAGTSGGAGAAAPKGSRRVRIYSDSGYAIGLLDKGWKAKANQELVARLRKRVAAVPHIEWVKVPGHAGVPENERCDQLARDAIQRALRR